MTLDRYKIKRDENYVSKNTLLLLLFYSKEAKHDKKNINPIVTHNNGVPF